MSQASSNEITQILQDVSAGDHSAATRLMPLVYDELRRLAQSYLKQERRGHTLQATALVHEAYIRLVDWENADWKNRAHFIGVAANIMRRILVDHARAHKADKRGGELQTISLDEAVGFPQRRDVDLIALDDALKELAEMDEQQNKIVELRFFGGLTIEETAHALNISPATVKREWTVARTWLHREITKNDEE